VISDIRQRTGIGEISATSGEKVQPGARGAGDQLKRPYFASLGCSRITLPMKLTALKIALPFEVDTPVLVLFSSNCTAHLKPVGLAVCTT
jgi:hypothetical protein